MPPADPNQPNQPVAPAPAPQTQPAPLAGANVDPGKTLGILGLIFAFFVPLVGLILSIIGMSKSKKAGFKNTPAVIGLILSIIFMVLGLIYTIVIIMAAASATTTTTIY